MSLAIRVKPPNSDRRERLRGEGSRLHTPLRTRVFKVTPVLAAGKEREPTEAGVLIARGR